MRVLFSGDVSFTGVFGQPGWTAARIDPEIRRFLDLADHAVLNLEGPVTTHAHCRFVAVLGCEAPVTPGQLLRKCGARF